MGSTQKPLDRPQVVRTIWSSWRARTKQSPRCPSSSLQNRGQTSHWMRPLSSTCQYFVGTVSPVMGASLLMPRESSHWGKQVGGGRGFPGVLLLQLAAQGEAEALSCPFGPLCPFRLLNPRQHPLPAAHEGERHDQTG